MISAAKLIDKHQELVDLFKELGFARENPVFFRGFSYEADKMCIMYFSDDSPGAWMDVGDRLLRLSDSLIDLLGEEVTLSSDEVVEPYYKVQLNKIER